MKVFCNRTSCKFNLREECRTSSISLDNGECDTFQQEGTVREEYDSLGFWGHLAVDPAPQDPSARPEFNQD